jgi:hypothetical protein
LLLPLPLRLTLTFRPRPLVRITRRYV